VSDLGSLAGLYRTVFWMIGRKAQYGRIWPREADMGTDIDEALPPAVTSLDTSHSEVEVEVGTRD